MQLNLASKSRADVVRNAVVGSVRESLRRNGGNVAQSAIELNISYRTLQRWITDLGLRRELAKQRRQSAA